MENKKMTKRDYFNALLEMESVNANADMVSFITHELELLDKKKSSSSKPTANQVENENIKVAIMEILTDSTAPMSITDIQAKNEYLSTLSNQKISALLTQLIAENKVVRQEIKKKAYFTVA